MELEEVNNGIVLKNINSFEPKHIFECGQAFRWHCEEDDSYTVISKGKVINVKKVGEEIFIDNTNAEDFYKLWYDYFDFQTDYEEIKKELAIDETMRKAIDYGKGLRVLNQEPFETIISFIISANNQIPRIKRSIELICENYGQLIENYKGRDYYSFPTAKKLASVDVQELREISRVGFRDERIVKTSELIADGKYNINSYFEKERETAKKELIELPGIGNKVADCILLFAYKKKDVFPVDVWIKRVMEALYIKEEMNIKKLADYGRNKFGKYAGIAQQYLFYYGRENAIGK